VSAFPARVGSDQLGLGLQKDCGHFSFSPPFSPSCFTKKPPPPPPLRCPREPSWQYWFSSLFLDPRCFADWLCFSLFFLFFLLGTPAAWTDKSQEPLQEQPPRTPFPSFSFQLAGGRRPFPSYNTRSARFDTMDMGSCGRPFFFTHCRSAFPPFSPFPLFRDQLGSTRRRRGSVPPPFFLLCSYAASAPVLPFLLLSFLPR